MTEARDIHVSGMVQGVGFRPFVYRLAHQHNLAGWVLNNVEGVFIHAEGRSIDIDRFVLGISEDAPPAAQVREIRIDEADVEGFDEFQIRQSDDADALATTLVSPDLATCDDCLRELFDPANRRFHYPFVNCTNCGPRFTIIKQLPYDRPGTSMAAFPMCEACQAEYDDPADRRFHAQPDACFDCGPSLCFAVLTNGEQWQWAHSREESDELIARVVQVLRDGGIAAVKGLGGFHLVCDASNSQALARLRTRKRRFGKAFAVMVRDVASAHRHCLVSEEEEALLASPARPIVLLRKKPGVRLAEGLADCLPELGVMLPATPVQHMLARAFDGMLVMTSGNVHDEPIQTDDELACVALAGIADCILGNNRPILSRYDDSVLRVLGIGEGDTVVQMIRRARGYCPLPIAVLPNGEKPDAPSLTLRPPAGLSDGGETLADPSAAGEPPQVEQPCVLATGAQQKNTFCLTRSAEAFVSQHIGDLENAAAQDAWQQALDTHRRLFDASPGLLACDKHPDYVTSKWARQQDLPTVEVQHHHAHIASVLGEHQLEGPVCGLAFDGTGYGEDGAVWGGEVLLANQAAFERFANFAYFPLPGGQAAILNPLRCAYGALWAFDLLEHPGAAGLLEALGEEAAVCQQMIDRSLNSPQTSSVGRLFDAASAILGVCATASYEGEPAVLLEAVAASKDRDMPSRAVPHDKNSQVKSASYCIDIVKNTATAQSTAADTSVVLLDPAPLFEALLDDLVAGVPIPTISQRFHDAFVQAIVQVAQLVQAAYGIGIVALSGGVFMNRYLVEHAVPALTQAGFTVALNRDLPPNDGCISYGQVVVASAQRVL